MLTSLWVWSSGIWSNILSLNLLDTWYGLTCSEGDWKQHIKDKIQNIGRRGDTEGSPR